MTESKKPQPPDIESRLKQMRTNEVLEDLRQKYDLGDSKPNEQNTSQDSDLGMSRVLADLNARRQRFLESLEGIPFHTEMIPANEIEQIVSARKLCRQFVEDSERATENLEKQERLNMLESKLKELEAALDKLPLWTHKFSTESEGGGAAGSEKMTINEETDSVYYVTQHGVSLRLKKSALSDGLQNVVSKFAERVFFIQGDEVSLKPELGYVAQEYFGDDFDQSVWSGAAHDFQSEIKIFQNEDGKVHAVLPADRDADLHTGDKVNNIYNI